MTNKYPINEKQIQKIRKVNTGKKVGNYFEKSRIKSIKARGI